jgi:cytochrome P450
MLLRQAVPNAPGTLPVLGNSLSLLGDDRLGYLTSLQPLGDVVRLRIGTRSFFVLNSPELVRSMLLEPKNFDRGRIFQKARPYVGDGLFTAAGAEHNRQRRMVQPAFHRAEIDRHVRTIDEVAREHVGRWQPGDTVEVEREMHVLMTEIIGRTMFKAPEAHEVVRLARDELPTLVQGLGARTVLPDFFTRIPVPVNRRFDAACANLRNATQRLVTAYREEHGDLGDFVSALMAARDARTGAAMSDVEIRDQVMTLLISGIETPATAMAWAMYELGANPELRRRMETEVDAGRTELTDAFVRETLRLHHPLWLLMRRAVRPVTLGGVTIPAGAEVIYSPAAMHRNGWIFPEPLKFDPDRWLGDAATPEMQRAFIPFSLGNRQCIGDHFAWTQMTTTLAAVVAGCRLVLPARYRPRTVVSSIVHLDRLPMTVHKR